jgi:hypothetical protein
LCTVLLMAVRREPVFPGATPKQSLITSSQPQPNHAIRHLTPGNAACGKLVGSQTQGFVVAAAMWLNPTSKGQQSKRLYPLNSGQYKTFPFPSRGSNQLGQHHQHPRISIRFPKKKEQTLGSNLQQTARWVTPTQRARGRARAKKRKKSGTRARARASNRGARRARAAGRKTMAAPPVEPPTQKATHACVYVVAQGQLALRTRAVLVAKPGGIHSEFAGSPTITHSAALQGC